MQGIKGWVQSCASESMKQKQEAAPASLSGTLHVIGVRDRAFSQEKKIL